MSDVRELRDRVERVIRSWHAYEISRHGRPVIDFECTPQTELIPPATSRIGVYRELTRLRAAAAESGAAARDVGDAVRAHRAYAGALLGRRDPLQTYLRETQGCAAESRPEQHIGQVQDRAVQALEDLGLTWGRELNRDLIELERPISADEAADLVLATASELKPAVQELVQTSATTWCG